MAEEIDESGFYRQDFSTVSDWEIFNAQLGEVFHKLFIRDDAWSGQVDVDAFHCGLDVQQETLVLNHRKISIDFYFPTNTGHNESAIVDKNVSMYKDLMDNRNTFGPPLISSGSSGSHPISSLYGLHRFVVIRPHQSQNQNFSNPSEFCFFLSAAIVVAAEYAPTVPIFVQIYNPKWNIFLGVGLYYTLRTNFDLVALNVAPIECRYLSGLLTIFKEKLPTNYTHAIVVSVRNTYALSTVQVRLPMSVPFHKPLNESNNHDYDWLNSEKYISLPCGYFSDSYTKLYIVCTWLETSDNIIDSTAHSEFVPTKSTNSKMYQIPHAVSYLSSCLRDFSKLSCDKDSLESFVGSSLNENDGRAQIANAFQHLTDPHLRYFRPNNDSSGCDTSNNKKKHKEIAGPLTAIEIKEFLAYLFPDLYPANAKHVYTNDGDKNLEGGSHRIKSSPFDSLSSRLCCLLATCNAHFGGKSGMAQAWVAFIKELRFIWNVRLSIPGVACGIPDTRYSLLNQKLQMLNYCIERSKFRKYGNQSFEQTEFDDLETYDNNFTEAADDDEDEFHDCAEYASEGRDKRLGDLKLLGCDEPLYIPITQDPVPKTEDELEADAEAMLKFGPGSDISMQLMCSALLSDMEAFKAANPKAKLEDFIRWYSPKDWEEDENFPSGRLSSRMQVPGNTWQTVWQEAQPVPASKQKRLFDETTEAEKVLAYLETRNIREIYQLVIITLLESAILKFKDIVDAAGIFDVFETQVEELLSELYYLSRDVEIFGQQETSMEQKTPIPDHIIDKLEMLETQFYQYKCFEQVVGYPHRISLVEIKQKFSELRKNNNCCGIKNSENGEKDIDANEGGLINLNLDNDLCNNLIIKEYVLRLRNEMAVGPQFLRAIVKGEEVRLCGAFTENTTLI